MKALAQLVGKMIEAFVVIILSAMSILVFLNVVVARHKNCEIEPLKLRNF